MRDIVYIALTLAFFGLAALFVVACDRIVGPDPLEGSDDAGLDEAAPADLATGVAP